MSGAWFPLNDGVMLGQGVLYFKKWRDLVISVFVINDNKPIYIDTDASVDELKDLCEVKFCDSTIFLSGFGKKTGQWMEWKIVDPVMYAEFA